MPFIKLVIGSITNKVVLLLGSDKIGAEYMYILICAWMHVHTRGIPKVTQYCDSRRSYRY